MREYIRAWTDWTVVLVSLEAKKLIFLLGRVSFWGCFCRLLSFSQAPWTAAHGTVKPHHCQDQSACAPLIEDHHAALADGGGPLAKNLS